MRSVANMVDNLSEKIRRVLYLTDKYPNPEHGWTCFHCGETFYRQFFARHHFGTTKTMARCQILTLRLEEIEDYLEQISGIDENPDIETDDHAAMEAQRLADHALSVIRNE